MRKSKAFRPAVSDALESRLVLSGVTALTAYRAGLGPAIQDILGPGGSLQNELDNALAPYTSSPSFTIKNSGPPQFAMLQAGVQSSIAAASNQLANLLSPLNKSRNIVATVQGELTGNQPGSLVVELNSLLNQLATTANVSNDPNGLVALVNPSDATLSYEAANNMMNSVYQAVENQVDLFNFAHGIANRPGRAFQAARASSVYNQLSSPFSTFTTKVQAAFAAYPAAPTPTDTMTFTTALFTQLGSLSVSANSIFASNGASGPLLSKLQGQVGGLASGSVYQNTTNLAFNEFDSSSTYSTGFVNLIIANTDTLMQYDLAATASA